MEVAKHPFGTYLREWRQRRRMSQLDLACEAGVSARHLSFVETGRSGPSRDLVLHLCEQLQVPLRERSLLLMAAGHAPVFPTRARDDPALAAARRAVELVLGGHEPYPALAVDRHWTLVAANRSVATLLEGADPALLAPPVNVLRLSLHPSGLAPRILNLGEWRAHLLARLSAQIDASADATLVALRDELAGYPAPSPVRQPMPEAFGGIAVPLRLDSPAGPLALISTTTVFGTPIEVTLAELAIEAFLPADAPTASLLSQLAAQRQADS